MTSRQDQLCHDAFLYSGEDEFAAALAPFVDEGLQRGDAVVAVTTPANVAALQGRLGPPSGSLEFVEADDWYRAPARTIARYRAKLDAALAGGAPRVRVIGEVAFGDTEVGQRAWVRYESVLNHVFADTSAWIVCPYDTGRLPPSVVEQAASTHPHLFGPAGRQASAAFVPPARLLRELPPAVEPPPAGAPESRLAGTRDLGTARAWLRQQAIATGLTAGRVEALLMAAGEVVANAFVHGRPPVRLRLWRCGRAVNVQVSDAGEGITDSLAGFAPPPREDPAREGMGLWLARQLCHSLEVLPGPGGTSVYLTVEV